MAETSAVTRDQDDALAKLAAIPPAGSEERDFWLEAAEQHGFMACTGGYIASTEVVLKLMSEARKQGQRDVLGAAPVNRNTPATDRGFFPETGNKFPECPNGGGTAVGRDGLRSTPEMRRAADEARTAHLRDVDANDQIGALTAAIEAALATREAARG